VTDRSVRERAAEAGERLAPEGACVFCDIRDGRLPAFTVLEDERCLAFLDRRPVFPGHVLLIPKAHHVTLMDLPPDLLAPLFGSALAGLPMAFWLAVILAALLWVLLRRTAVGQAMTAVGLNESGAIFAGIRTRWIKVLAFALSGLLAGVAGIMIIAQAGAASSFGLGSDLLLPGIAAAIVGGTAITGGSTNPLNVIFGALTITLIPIGAATLGVPPQAQSLVYGLVIIIAVALTRSRASGEIVK